MIEVLVLVAFIGFIWFSINHEEESSAKIRKEQEQFYKDLNAKIQGSQVNEAN